MDRSTSSSAFSDWSSLQSLRGSSISISSRNRSRSPDRKDRQSRSRTRVRSPSQAHRSSSLMRFDDDDDDIVAGPRRDLFFKEHSETPAPLPRNSAMLYCNNFDQFGIPIYPREPEPLPTNYGRDQYGEVTNPYQKKNGPRFCNPTKGPKRPYPSVPDFFTANLPRSVGELVSISARRKLNGQNTTTPTGEKATKGETCKSNMHVALPPSSMAVENYVPGIANVTGLAPLQDVTNTSASRKTDTNSVVQIEEDLITFDNSWGGDENVKNMVELMAFSSSPLRPSPLSKTTVSAQAAEFLAIDELPTGAVEPRVAYKDPYDILGIPWGVSNTDAFAAYDRLRSENENIMLSGAQDPSIQNACDERARLLEIARHRLRF